MNNYMIQIQTDLISYSQELKRVEGVKDEMRELYKTYIGRLSELRADSQEYMIVISAASAIKMFLDKLNDAIAE